MSNDKTRNDFIFFQNEILGDIKKIETKLMDKLAQTITAMENLSKKNENRFQEILIKFNFLSEKVEKGDNTQKMEQSMHLSQQKLEELISKIDIRLGLLEKDFNNACFKYDKIFSNNLTVPGLIGTSCPYTDLRPFLDYTNKKLIELIKAKEKQIIDNKKYKEKMETLIAQNKTQIETTQNKISDYCHQGFEQCDIACKDRINVIEKRIETMRLENGQYALNLKNKAEELHIEWEKLNAIENDLNKRYTEEVNKLKDLVDRIGNKVEKNNSEYNIIKTKFTELSEFIKDVRFKKNLDKLNAGDYYKERRQYKEMSEKIDFSKKHRIKRISIEKRDNDCIQYNEEGDNNNDIINEIKSYDDDNENTKKEKEKEYIKENNNDKSKIIDEISNKKKDLMIQKNFFAENNFNTSNINLNKSLNNKSMNDIFNNSSYFQNSTSKNNNIYNQNSKINQDNKHLFMKKSNYQNFNKNINTSNSMYYNNDSNTINVINYSHYNNENNRNNHYNDVKSCDNINPRNNIKEKREHIKNNLILLAENAKINNVVLGADFNRKCYNGTTFNLSQAYILAKKKTEEVQKMKKYNMGKSESKVHQKSPSSSLNNSKNINNNNNYLSKKDFKNKSDIFYTSIKKENIKRIYNPNIFFNLTSHTTMNNLYQNNYPNIFKSKNENTYNHVELNTININDNNIDNIPISQNSRNTKKIQKKIINSSSVENLLVKSSPFWPNFNEHLSLHKNKRYYNKLLRNNNSKEGKVKESLNSINPYLVQKFKGS